MSEIASILLVHGAGSGPWVFDGWRGRFGHLDLEALDLQAGLNVAEAAMSNYAAVVVRDAELLPRPLALLGWSMGGLAAMAAARRVEPEALVLLEPSPPSQVQGFDVSVVPAAGTFDPEEVYGPFPPGVRVRAESSLARAERRRGISIAALPPRTLVLYGDEFAEERGRPLARRYGTDELHLPGSSHWDLVLGKEARAAVIDYLTRSAG